MSATSNPLKWPLIAAVFVIIVLTYAVLELNDRQNDIDNVARTARTAAREAQAASSRTRVLAVNNAENARVAKQLADELNRAVCAWRDDLEERVRSQQRNIEQTEEFLAGGGGIPGVPPELLRESLDQRKESLRNLRKTVRAFQQIDCK